MVTHGDYVEYFQVLGIVIAGCVLTKIGYTINTEHGIAGIGTCNDCTNSLRVSNKSNNGNIYILFSGYHLIIIMSN